jgi:hypothetical protein
VSEYKRLTIDVAPDLAEELQRRADRQGIDLTEWLRRAVALSMFFDNIVSEGEETP